MEQVPTKSDTSKPNQHEGIGLSTLQRDLSKREGETIQIFRSSSRAECSASLNKFTTIFQEEVYAIDIN